MSDQTTTSQNPEELEGLDLTEVAFQLSQYVLKMISNKEIETVEHTIQIKLPKEISEILSTYATKQGIEISELLSSMASNNIQHRLQHKMKESAAPKAEVNPSQEVMQATGMDMTKIMEGFQKMQDLAGTLQGLQTQLNDNTSKNSQDSEKSSLSNSKIHWNKDQ